MEKLIELLNEYGNEICNHWGDYQTDMDFTDRDIYWYLSKKFGFIKRLVENDKIDFEGMSGHADIIKYLRDAKKYGWEQIKEGVVLMLLSISDKPIEFLVSLLKNV